MLTTNRRFFVWMVSNDWRFVLRIFFLLLQKHKSIQFSDDFHAQMILETASDVVKALSPVLFSNPAKFLFDSVGWLIINVDRNFDIRGDCFVVVDASIEQYKSNCNELIIKSFSEKTCGIYVNALNEDDPLVFIFQKWVLEKPLQSYKCILMWT